MTQHRPLILMVTGSTPGLGKTTLCRRLVAHLNGSNRPAVLFAEEDILQRAEFAETIAAWKTGEPVPREVLLDAAERYSDTCRREDAQIFVQDMLFPYLPSLLSWGYGDREIRDFFEAIGDRCKAADLVQIHLTGDPRSALQRARQRSGEGWFRLLLSAVSDYANQVETLADLDGLAGYFVGATERTRRLLEATPWPVIRVDVERGEDEVAARAIERLDALYRRMGSRNHGA